MTFPGRKCREGTPYLWNFRLPLQAWTLYPGGGPKWATFGGGYFQRQMESSAYNRRQEEAASLGGTPHDPVLSRQQEDTLQLDTRLRGGAIHRLALSPNRLMSIQQGQLQAPPLPGRGSKAKARRKNTERLPHSRTPSQSPLSP